MRKKRENIPTAPVVLATLKSAINNHSPIKNRKREQWKHYRYFFATRTVKDMPVGTGAFIAIAGIIHPPHEGWYYVATRELQKNLKLWEHWPNIAGLSRNEDLQRLVVPVLMTRLKEHSENPRDWVTLQSSKHPEDWIVVQSRPGSGRKKHLT